MVQIVLWASLGDSDHGVKCSDLPSTRGDNADFLILWQATACLYFVTSIILVVVFSYFIMIYWDCAQSSEKGSHPDNTGDESELRVTTKTESELHGVQVEKRKYGYEAI